MSKSRILIIDDDPALRKTLTDILRIKGFETLTAANAAEGLVFLAEHSVNVVLIDLGLPDMPGIELLQRVKADYPMTEAIIITGNATLDSAIAATNKGAFSYLLKPYDVEQLIVNVNGAIEKQRAREENARRRAEVERSNTELKALNDISCAVSRAIDMDTLLSEVLGVLVNMKIFPFEIKGTLSFLENGELRRVSSIGLPEDGIVPCQLVKPGECHCDRAVQSGNVVMSNTHPESCRHTMCNRGIDNPYGQIAVPLKAADKVVGVLSIYTWTETEAGERLTGLLSTMGNQIGVAVKNAQLYEKTKASALHDSLTGLANRRFMETQLEKHFEIAKRYGERFSIIMVDIDHFKRYNDTYGHQGGDKLLVVLAGILLREIRRLDYVFRYGGEEFLIVLPHTDLPMACTFAERLRKAVEETGATISLGVSAYRDTLPDKETLVGMADAALYRAKERGRNRVEANGGRIEVESRIGEGTTFAVTLPIRERSGGNEPQGG